MLTSKLISADMSLLVSIYQTKVYLSEFDYSSHVTPPTNAGILASLRSHLSSRGLARSSRVIINLGHIRPISGRTIEFYDPADRAMGLICYVFLRALAIGENLLYRYTFQRTWFARLRT